MIGHELEIWFEHPTNGWYRGKVISIVNGMTDRVKIVLNAEGLHADDPTKIVQYLKDNKYNSKRAKKGAWRQYFDLHNLISI